MDYLSTGHMALARMRKNKWRVRKCLEDAFDLAVKNDSDFLKQYGITPVDVKLYFFAVDGLLGKKEFVEWNEEELKNG